MRTESKMDWYLHREVTTEFQKVARNGANQYTAHITRIAKLSGTYWGMA